MRRLITLLLLFSIYHLLSIEHIGPPGIYGKFIAIDPITGYDYVTTKHETVYKVDLSSNNWQKLNLGLTAGESIGGIDAFDDVIIVTTTEHVYRSNNGGLNWQISESGILEIGIGENVHIYEPDPNIVFIQVGANIWYRSLDNGIYWNQMPLIGAKPFSYNQETGLIVIMNSDIMWRSYNIGETWEEIQVSITPNYIILTSLLIRDDSTYICAGYNNNFEERVFISYNAGSTWENITFGYDFDYVSCIIEHQDEVYISVVRGESESPHAGVFRLDISNQTWHQIGNTFARENTGYNIESINNEIHHLSLASGLFSYHTITNETSNYLPENVFETNPRICNGNSISNIHIDVRSSFLFYGENNFTQWTRIDSVYNIFQMARSQFDADLCLALSIRRGVYRSIDGGTNWTLSNSGIAEEDRSLINNVHFLSDNVILISGYEAMLHSQNTKSFIYRSEDSGLSWIKTHEANSTLGDNPISLDDMIQSYGNYYALMYNNGLQKTEDLGFTWETVFYLDNRVFYNMVYDPTSETIYVVTQNSSYTPSISEIYKSNDFAEWYECAGSFNDEYNIIDIGLNPNQTGSVFCSISSRDNINGSSPHLMITNDNCISWDEFSFPEISLYSRITDIGVIPDSNELLFCVSYSSMYKSDLNFLSSKDNIIESNENVLYNYPNPFNPDTRIVFGLPEAGKVEVIIYNIKGQKVKTLIAAELSSGKVSCTWDGRNENGKRVASGEYIVKLKVNGEEKAVHKILLLK